MLTVIIGLICVILLIYSIMMTLQVKDISKQLRFIDEEHTRMKIRTQLTWGFLVILCDLSMIIWITFINGRRRPGYQKRVYNKRLLAYLTALEPH